MAPRSSRAAITGVHQGALKVSLTAPPVGGAANAALIELLAAELRVPRRAISIARGQRSKTKTVSVQGIGAEALLNKLSPQEPGRHPG